MSILPQRGQDEEATQYLDRILPELNEVLENVISGGAFVKDGKIYVKIVSPYNAADKDLELGKMLTNAANIVTIDTEKLEDAAITTAKLANGSLDLTKFASDIEPVQVVSNLNSISSPSQGQVAFLTSDNSLYRYTGGAWTKAVPTADLTGTIGSTQIADNAVTTDKITANAITTGKIAAGAINTNELAANAITSAKLATNELITSSAQMGDATILTAAIGDAQITNAKVNDLSANKITAGLLAADRLAANSITAGKIAADTITSDKIAANAITTSELASNSVTADKIQSNAITTDKLSANSITSAKLATSSLITQSAQIDDGIITNAKINTLNADKISGGTISASFLSGGTLTIGSGGIQTIVGSFNPENLNAGVILQILASSAGRGAVNQSPITIPNTTFTSTNNSSFNTDAVVILIANASCGSSNQGTTIATRFMTGSTALALSPAASATGAGTADVRIQAAKIQLNKNQQYFASIAYNDAGQGEAGQGTGSVVILEVRRV